MPTNNFKLFDENKANMMTDEEYAQNAQRLNGVQSGVASSQLQNKTLYQTALMCYALAQLMAANGFDANDANAVSTFVNNLSSSVLQKVADKASAADIANKVAGKWVDSSIFGQNMQSLGETYLKLAGGTMTGNLILNGDPTLALQAATKQYVDEKVGTNGKNCRILQGSYVGNGKWGQSNPNIINCGFYPVYFSVGTDDTSNKKHCCEYILRSGVYLNPPISGYWSNFTWKNDGVTWYTTGNPYTPSEDYSYDQWNKSGTTYYYIILGYDM